MRIVSAGMDPGDGFLDPGGSSQEFTFCFEVRFAPNKAWTPHEVPCPEADPIAFPPAQLQPGALTCSADEAVGGAGINPPH